MLVARLALRVSRSAGDKSGPKAGNQPEDPAGSRADTKAFWTPEEEKMLLYEHYKARQAKVFARKGTWVVSNVLLTYPV